jgi:hypothetical protein
MGRHKKPKAKTAYELLLEKQIMQELANKFIHENIKSLVDCFIGAYEGKITFCEELEWKPLINVLYMEDISEYVDFPNEVKKIEALNTALQNFDLNGIYETTFLLSIWSELDKDSVFSHLLLYHALKKAQPDGDIIFRKASARYPFDSMGIKLPGEDYCDVEYFDTRYWDKYLGF